MEDVFKITTVNHTYGEVYVNAPLDRESVDRYLLKVRYSISPHAVLKEHIASFVLYDINIHINNGHRILYG